jgi:copper chaperone CopZ
MEKVIVINGMHCEHCKAAVEKALSAIKGAEVKVDLKQKTATIKSKAIIDDQILKNAVTDAGYEVVSISTR